MGKITNKFRERKEVIQTANKFEKTKSKQTTVAFLLNFIEEVILICLIQTQIKNSQSVRRDVVKTTHYVKRLRRHLILKTQLMLHGIMWFCTQDRFLPKFSWFVPSLSWLVTKLLVDLYPSQYTFIWNTSHASVWTDITCCVQQVSEVKRVR